MHQHSSVAAVVMSRLSVVLPTMLSQVEHLEHIGGIIHGKALGNTPKIGDFDLVEPDHQFVNVEGTVNIFPSNTCPTTMDINETAVIAAIVPFEESLGSLHSVSKYYSSMSGMYSKVYLKIMILIFYF